jgi:hypothetical protein
MKFVGALALCLALAACQAQPARGPVDGEAVDTPAWGAIFCQEHPAKPECR